MKQAAIVWVSLSIGFYFGQLKQIEGPPGPAGPPGVMGPMGPNNVEFIH